MTRLGHIRDPIYIYIYIHIHIQTTRSNLLHLLLF
jgi:hypothetical protein